MHAVLLAQQTPPGNNPIGGLLPLVLIGVVFYLLVIRPQRTRAKQQRELVSSIGPGDRIVTIGGLQGTVEAVEDDAVRLEIADGVVVTFLKQAVARRILDDDDSDDDSDDSDDDDTPVDADETTLP